MIRINLLPHREGRRKAQREQFYALAALMLALAAMVWFAGYNLIDSMSLHQQDNNNFLKQEIAVLDKQIQDIGKLREQTQSLLQRKRIIEALQANRTEIVHLFNELAHRLPPGIFLHTLKQEGQSITLQGYAQSSARVSTLMHNLDESPVFEKPVLIEIKAALDGKRRTNEFALSVFFTRQSTDGEEASVGGKAPGGAK